MRWDPNIRELVHEVCQQNFNCSFETMLARNPRWIAERCPRHIPAPSILVHALEFVFGVFGHGTNARSGDPLFNHTAWQKAHAVLQLAREGYLSDNEGVILYEEAGVDQYGLRKYDCSRGTNKVEGGPHADIYRKFGALNAGPRYTVNSLTDHRTFYNLQAYAKYMFGLDWRYHHSLAMINRTAFLLNYLWDIVPGASAYADWMNGDLYIQTEETFGMCRFPESLRERLEMQSYPEQNTPFARSLPHFKANDEWLRSRQALAMPARPPTTSEARSYFFANIKIFSAQAAQDGKRKINFDQFAPQWNRTADGKTRFYITPELLMAYAKGWERTNNIRASQEIINDTLKDVSRSAAAFIADDEFLMLRPFRRQCQARSTHLLHGVQ
ncbi:hypothetical protein BDZ89DRAFT_1151259 [Hymenopellis radicata]|nr:hypothetical protein BDZ89DRAFT_1151259 [Hymenopellis radicata]